MTTENHADNTQLPNKPNQFGDFWGAVNRKTRYCAKKIHQAGFIYAMYGALDGLSLSYSTLKYFFDVFFTNAGLPASDIMHTWMMTPTGIAVAATESISIIVFSLLANVLDDKSSNLFKKYTVILWPYCRDVMKSLKNSYKGVRSTLTVINLLGDSSGINLNFLMLPVGLLLGCLSVLNRLAFRRLIESRKDMMKANRSALAEIRKTSSLTEQQCVKYRQEMLQQSQSMAARAAGYLSQAYSGVVDSLYLYVGVLGLCSLAWPALLAMSIFCVIYSLANIVARLYEEFDNQQKLLIRHAKIDLHLYGKEHGLAMQESFNQLLELQENIFSKKEIDTAQNLKNEQKILAKNILEKIKIFTQKREHLKALSRTSFISAFFLGIKNGLHAYGALNSAIFALATVLFLCSTAFPASLLIAAISTGMALLIGFVSWTLISTYHQYAKQQASVDRPYDSLVNMLSVLEKATAQDDRLKNHFANNVHEVISNSLLIDPSPQYAFQEGFEVIRSLFSGLPKGNKSVDYTLNPLQEVDAAGHCHDTPVMFVLSAFSAVIYAITMALRAFARGFGRSSLEQDEEVDVFAATISQPVSEQSPPDESHPENLAVITEAEDNIESLKEKISTSPAPLKNAPLKLVRASSCPQIFFKTPPESLSSPPRAATAPPYNSDNLADNLEQCGSQMLSITVG